MNYEQKGNILLEKFKSQGLNVGEFKRDVYLVYLLADIQEVYLNRVARAMKLAGNYTFGDKAIIETALNHVKKVRKIADQVQTLDNAEAYGEASDEIIKMLDQFIDAR